MINAITTKLELDAFNAADLDQSVQLAVVHKLPAIVVHNQLVSTTTLLRIRRHGSFKIITTIDWPKGDIYGILKMRGMTTEMMNADGYEIMVSHGMNEAETRNELKLLSDFIKNHISTATEVRFVLAAQTQPEANIMQICKVIKDIPQPAFLRTDQHLKLQVTKANITTHTALIEKIRTVASVPLKLSGNIDSARTLAGCVHAGAARLAVSLSQLQAIIRDLQKQPGELHKLLTSND